MNAKNSLAVLAAWGAAQTTLFMSLQAHVDAATNLARLAADHPGQVALFLPA